MSVNYGFPPKDLDARVEDTCRVVASYGGRDRPLRGAAATLETALTGAGIVHDVKEDPDAGHGFLNTAPNGPRVMRPLFRVAGMGPDPVADDAWRRIEAFFHANLEGASRTPEAGPGLRREFGSSPMQGAARIATPAAGMYPHR